MEDNEPRAEGAENPEFAAILNRARDIDKAAEDVLSGGAKPAAQAPVEVIDPAEAWADVAALVGMVVGSALPEVKPAYSPDNCYAWGKAMHKVAVKRGWSGEGLPPEAGALVATAMFVLPTMQAIQIRRRAAADARQAQGQSAPGGAAAGVLPEITGIQHGPQAGG